MPKQYTFKTTRKTEWMESILDQVDPSDKSSFIREMMMLGMKTAGIIEEVYEKNYFNGFGDTKVVVTTDKTMTKEIPKTHLGNTKESPRISIPEPRLVENAPSMGEGIEDVKDPDLDSKLDSLF